MDIRGKGVDFDTVVRLMSNATGDNIEIHPDAKPLGDRGYGFRGRIMARDSRGVQARRSASGRYGPYACWHAYRDAMRAVLNAYPQATIKTGMAVYRGLDGFEQTYPTTADVNVGSMVSPAYMTELCDCFDME